MNYLFDTNAIIYLLSGQGKFPQFHENDNFYISFITQIELLSGDIDDKTKTEIEKALNNFNIIHSNPNIADYSILFRKRYSLKVPDSIISATSKILDASIITADKQIINKLHEQISIINPLS